MRTLGGKTKFCDDKDFSSYDPYESVELNSTNFPFAFVSDSRSEDDNYFSLAPRELLMVENFAMCGVGDIDVKECRTYNSGDDVQSYAGAAWLPFVSEIRYKTNALRNYNGYYIGNSLMGKLFNYTEADFKNFHKITLTSIYFNADLYDNESLFRNYTDVYPFGCRSKLNQRQFKEAKIKSYFSACLTLTTSMQGAILDDQKSYANYMLNDILKPNARALPSPKNNH